MSLLTHPIDLIELRNKLIRVKLFKLIDSLPQINYLMIMVCNRFPEYVIISVSIRLCPDLISNQPSTLIK